LPLQVFHFIGALNYEVVDYYTVTLPHDATEGIVSIAVVSSASRLEHGITFAVYKL